MIVTVPFSPVHPSQTEYVRDRAYYLSELITDVSFDNGKLEVSYSGGDTEQFRKKLESLVEESRKVRTLSKKRIKQSGAHECGSHEPGYPRIAERPRDPHAFASSFNGGVHLQGEAALLPAALERLFRDKLGPAGFVLRKYPSLMSREIMTKSKYPVHFPQNIYRLSELSHDIDRITEFHRSGGNREDLYSATDFYMQPCVCFQVYNELGEQAGPVPGNVVYAATGRCFRHEHRSRINEVRGLEFDMHEFVYVGDADFVRKTRDELAEKTWELFCELGFTGVVETAADHFFHHVDVGKTLFQLAGELKYELRVAPREGLAWSLASFNLFGDVLCSSFGIGGERNILHSGCAAYGIDRWIQALLYYYGDRSADWPSVIRERL
ncbi:hypothetical protein P4H65_13095 [Paenibacillus chitinolyticus]|uniref:hypothetical protein n=1 Tax=Paenibacillus chitinolyticus TaxID=79263 RepID=UPI002DBF4576|nr:hypothetical protein [Paenibacillus chitinolyticus]MEC0246724.1 hypothetical protein [Paenibacillus chitinolyticus]